MELRVLTLEGDKRPTEWSTVGVLFVIVMPNGVLITCRNIGTLGGCEHVMGCIGWGTMDVSSCSMNRH